MRGQHLFAAKRIVILLLALQVAATVFLWTLNALNQASNGTYALFIAVDLISFAMISYVYRAEKWSEPLGKTWLIVGSGLVVLLLLASLVLS